MVNFRKIDEENGDEDNNKPLEIFKCLWGQDIVSCLHAVHNEIVLSGLYEYVELRFLSQGGNGSGPSTTTELWKYHVHSMDDNITWININMFSGN